MMQPIDDSLRNEIIRLLLPPDDADQIVAQASQLDAALRDMPAARLAYLCHIELLGSVYWNRVAESRETAIPRTELTPRIASRRFNASRLLAIAASLLLVGYFVSVAGLLMWDRLHRADNHEQLAGQPLKGIPASLSSADNATWTEERTLQVRSGLAEVKFSLGATVVVEGPAEFKVQSGNQGFLRHGKLVATVPRSAIGFTVETPTATIVDLGTEFGVEVSDSGDTDVRVTKGKVQLHPGRIKGGLALPPPITLSAGTARRVSVSAAGVLTVHELAPRLASDPQATKSADPMRLPIVGAMASSETNVVRQANNLINGSGLKGEVHTNSSENTMWLTALNHVKGEFVLFDLGRIRRLESMKVWNFNENIHPVDGHITNLFAERGVAQADIYVSTTGKGDPISRPDDWQLVVKSQKFAPADGTPEYATPDLIPLQNVEARFAAIVIRERHHPERMHESGDCVGLSEVQFFGQAIESSPARTEKH